MKIRGACIDTDNNTYLNLFSVLFCCKIKRYMYKYIHWLLFPNWVAKLIGKEIV